MADRYWVGGSGTWSTTSTTNWSATSNGLGGASVPTIADNVFFNQNSTYTVTMTGALNCLDFAVSAGVVTFANGTTPTLQVRGGWATIYTIWDVTGLVTFTSTSGRTITTSGTLIRSPWTFNGSGGSWTLLDNLTLGTTVTTTLSAGTLSLGSFVLTTGLFNGTGTATRTLAFGTGKIRVINDGTATIWTTANATGLTVTGTPLVECSGGGVTKTINSGGITEANNPISFSLLDPSAATYVFTAGMTVKNLTINGNQQINNIAITIFGNYTYSNTNGNSSFVGGTNAWTFGATSGTSIITAPTTHNFPIIFGTAGSTAATFRLAANFDVGTRGDGIAPASMRTATLTAGTLNLNNFVLTTDIFSSTNTNTRVIAFGASGRIELNTTPGSAITTTTIWNTATTTNFSHTGTSEIRTTGSAFRATFTQLVSTGAMTESQALNWNVTNYYAGITFTANNVVKNLTLAANGDFVMTNVALTIFGSLTHISGSPAAGTNAWRFAATAGANGITSNGYTYEFPWTFNGAGGTILLQSAVTVGATRTTTLTNGTLDLNGFTFTTGFFTTAAGTKSLQFDGGTLVVTGSGATAFNNANPTNFTVSLGTGTSSVISLTSSLAKTFVGNGIDYSGIILNQGGTGTLTVTGSNTFEDISASISANADSTVSFTAGTTTIFNKFTTTGLLYRIKLSSTVVGSVVTFYKAPGLTGFVDTGSNNIIVQDIAFTPAAAVDGTDYIRWHIGANSLIFNSTGALAQTYVAGATHKLYVLATGSTWTVPSDFNTTKNTVHIIGGGGGGGRTSVNATGPGGGGGGGYTQISNFNPRNLTVVSYSVGAGGLGGTVTAGGQGGTTTFSTYSAPGGNGAPSGTVVTGGTGGIGATASGGNGGSGAKNGSSRGQGGGGGGGAGGPLGNGAAGGTGAGDVSSGTAEQAGGGGGGGNGGGSAGGNSTSSIGNPGGPGGNNAGGIGGGVGTATVPAPGVAGGGGSGGGRSTNLTGQGGSGADILNSVGSGGGSGGRSQGGAGGAAVGGKYGGGGGGGGGQLGGLGSNGGDGGLGVVIIQYLPVTPRFMGWFN
jgi:hypothetical protein